MKAIPENKWKWFGSALHFCMASKCLFHLSTQVGKYAISTVGDLIIDGKTQEVGLNREFETMVFKVKGACECGCGAPEIDLSELDMKGYHNRADANKGHLAFCKQYSRL